MVKVNKDFQDIPASLISERTNNKRKEIIANGEYDKSGNSFYREQDIKDALKAIYNNKCAYCEQYIEEFHVEHYRPKSTYYWLAFSWDNLLLVCPKCNTKKLHKFPISGDRQSFDDSFTRDIHNLISIHDSNENPLIINPEQDDPEMYFSFDKEGHIMENSDSPRGITTIEECGLNRTDLVDRRKGKFDELINSINAYLFIEQYDDTAKKKAMVVIEQFINSSKNPKKDFLAFRRYVLTHLLRDSINIVR